MHLVGLDLLLVCPNLIGIVVNIAGFREGDGGSYFMRASEDHLLGQTSEVFELLLAILCSGFADVRQRLDTLDLITEIGLNLPGTGLEDGLNGDPDQVGHLARCVLDTLHVGVRVLKGLVPVANPAVDMFLNMKA